LAFPAFLPSLEIPERPRGILEDEGMEGFAKESRKAGNGGRGSYSQEQNWHQSPSVETRVRGEAQERIRLAQREERMRLLYSG
jgi:hypothetical protein